MKTLKIILLALAIIAFQAHARETKNLAVQETGNAAKRVALVIGNDHYSTVTPLKNAVADARSMAAALERAGFEVTLKTDANLAAMKLVVRQFKARLSGGDEAVFFYSGHGVQLGAANYLLPVDITSDNEEQVKDDAIPLQRLLDDLQDQKVKFALAIIDACRDNPFKGHGRNIGGTRGLAPTSAANGQMVIFSAGNGQQALDKLGNTDRDKNGVFTRVFLQEMQKPGVEVHQVLRNVRSRVVQMAKSVNHDQMPALYDQVEGDFHFYQDAGQGIQVANLVPVPTAVTHVPAADDAEEILWQAAESSGIEEDARTYLSQYPNGRYIAQAHARIRQIADDAAKAKVQKEQEAWQVAGKANTEESYQQYLQAYPAGRYVALVMGRLDKLRSDLGAREEAELWHKADSGTGKTAVETYLNRYPSGRYLAAASAKLQALKEEEAKGPAMVRIPGKNYEIGKTEVTQKEWREVMGNNPPELRFKQCGDTCPVENVSWNDIQEFLQKLNTKTGKQYRLPNEVEWEYACYGGSQTRFCGGNDLNAVGWYGDNSNNTPHPVGQMQPNGYGLYDMSGNVFEWMSDCWEGDCAKRVLRGGSWHAHTMFGQSAYRFFRNDAANRYSYFGFRLTRTLP